MDSLIAVNSITTCDTLFTVLYHYQAIARDTIRKTSCKGFTYNGKAYSVAGTYFDTIRRAEYNVYLVIELYKGSEIENTITETACKSFNFNGTIVTKSGSYKDTLQAANGCDSIITLNLTLNQFVYDTVKATACTSYPFAGKELTVAGTYNDTIRQQNQCDIVKVLKLTFSKVLSSDVTISACKSYTFAGKTLTESGDYLDTVKTSQGCDSVITLHLQVNRFVYDTVHKSSCGSYSYAGKIYAESRLFNDTIINKLGCDTVRVIDYKVIPFKTITDEIITHVLVSKDEEHTKTWITIDTIADGSTCGAIRTTTHREHAYMYDTLLHTSCQPIFFNNKLYDKSGIYHDTIESNVSIYKTIIVKITKTLDTLIKETACKSYNFNGVVYDKSGLYRDTVKTESGCDSVISLQLTIEQFTYDTLKVTACTSYTFGSKELTAPGQYNDTVRNEQSCDLVKTLILTFNSVLTNEKTVTECKSYSFAGKTLTQSGEYRDTVKSIQGCDSINILHLTINKFVEVPYSLNSCKPISFKGKTYDKSGVYKDTIRYNLANQCDTVFILSVSIKAIEYSFATSDCKPFVFNGKTYKYSGNYTDTLKTANGCDSIVSLQLTINRDVLPLSVTQTTPLTYRNKTYSKTGIYYDTISYSGHCDTVCIINFTLTPKLPTISVLQKVLDSTIYVFNAKQSILTAQEKYEYTVQISIANNLIKRVELATDLSQLPTQLEIDNQVAVLRALATKSSAIKVTKTVQACGQYNFMETIYKQSGTYIDTTKSVKGYDSIVTLQLTINPVPAPPVISKSEVFNCSGDAKYHAIEATAASAIVWYEYIANGTDTIIGRSEPNTGSAQHSFTLKGKIVSRTVYGQTNSGSCTTLGERIKLTVAPTPTPKLVGTSEVLEGNTGVEFAAIVSNKNNTLAWKTTMPFMYKINDNQTIVADFPKAKTDTVTITETYTDNNISCSASVSKIIVTKARVATQIVAKAASRIYPNPTHGQFVIELPSTESLTAFVQIIATNGDVLSLPVVIANNTIIVDQHLAAGTYSIEVLTNNEIFTANIVVQ